TLPSGRGVARLAPPLSPGLATRGWRGFFALLSVSIDLSPRGPHRHKREARCLCVVVQRERSERRLVVGSHRHKREARCLCVGVQRERSERRLAVRTKRRGGHPKVTTPPLFRGYSLQSASITRISAMSSPGILPLS